MPSLEVAPTTVAAFFPVTVNFVPTLTFESDWDSLRETSMPNNELEGHLVDTSLS